MLLLHVRENRGMVEAARVPEAVLIFDGECGFCARSLGWLQRLDRRARIDAIPFQRPGIGVEYGLAPEDLAKSIWLITDQPPRSGAAAVSGALDIALGVRVFGWLYRVPGIGWIQERVYRWVATHRHRLKGKTPWCHSHPEDCSAP